MKKFNLAKLLSLVLVFTLLMGTFAVLPASAAEAPSIKFVSNNVFFGEKIHLMYAVETANAPAGAKVVVTVSDGTNTYATEEKSDATYGTVYVSKSGVAAQNIATVYTATATLMDGDTVVATATQTYSVLEYLYTRLLVSTEKTEAQVAMYNSLLDYAAKAEAVLCADRETKVNDYVLVTAKDATVNGETSLIVKKGTAVTPVLDAGFTVPSGNTVVWKVKDHKTGLVISSVDADTVVSEGIVVEGNYEIFADTVASDRVGTTVNYAHTLEKSKSVYGVNTYGDLKWTVTGTSTASLGWDSNATNKGVQFGTAKDPNTTMTITSVDSLEDVTSVVINASGASSIVGKLTVTVGGKQIGETVNLTTTATEYTFTSEEPLSGQVVFTFTQTSSKAFYVKSLGVTYIKYED